MKEVLPCLVRWALCPYLADLVGPVKIFLTAHFFTLMSSITQQPGQSVVPGRLSLDMCP
jgi:hypothetical protein